MKTSEKATHDYLLTFEAKLNFLIGEVSHVVGEVMALTNEQGNDISLQVKKVYMHGSVANLAWAPYDGK